MNATSSLVWWITGASRGFGRALVEKALATGDRVIATARQPDALQDLADLAPDQLRVLELDVTQPARIRAVIEESLGLWGRIDVVMNNAGYGLLAALEETDDEALEACLTTNLRGPLQVMRAVLPHLRAQKSGHLINMSAAAAITNYPGFAVYGAAKAALEAASEAIRQEVAPLGIRVTLVEPGPFRTDFASRSLAHGALRLPEYEPTVGRFRTTLERLQGRQPGDPERAAAAIVHVAHQPEGPFRLVLGRYAVDKTRRMLAARTAELQAWEATGQAADYPR